jgi:hypothetical protein
MKDIKKEAFNENYPIPVSIQGTEQILFQMKNCIFKIYVDGQTGTGFFCKIPYKNGLSTLITSSHVLTEEYINKNKVLIISINDEKKTC